MEIRFVPSPEKIAADCATIRAGWTDRERRRRLAGWAVLTKMLHLVRRRRGRFSAGVKGSDGDGDPE